ncbi:hypothetical protein CQW23_28401 [Capsicum baccatum]|uniref:CCHC-type domain-containing protein n=1 Tax=Capsicum baccatum TaxID=33114 RepID=A0A2G2VGF3_CAPBA|nr:hypothetical protein CQW23_28401 [Capsicum baccatum]
MHSMMARLQVHIILNGLDVEFDKVRGEILRKYPKLDLENTYAYVRREAQQRQTMRSARLIHVSSVMAVHRSSRVKGQTNQPSGKPNDLTCSHCGESGHSKQRCYEIIGYPNWWDFSKKPHKDILTQGTLGYGVKQGNIYFVELTKVAHEDNEGTRKKGNKSHKDTIEENEEIIPERIKTTTLTNESSQNFLHDHIPQIPLSNGPYLSPSHFPLRKNKGVPRINCEPDLNANSKYPISNYTSTKRLSTSYALTVNQLYKVSIPSGVQEALAESQWKKAMNEEMEALQKIKLGN